MKPQAEEKRQQVAVAVELAIRRYVSAEVQTYEGCSRVNGLRLTRKRVATCVPAQALPPLPHFGLTHGRINGYGPGLPRGQLSGSPFAVPFCC